jgi:glycosyltransferase involved in cell wall biosynthesis
MYCHNFAKYLISKGHEVRVLLMESRHYNITEVYEYEGVTVVPAMEGMNLDPSLRWADLVITHLVFAKWTVMICRQLNKPCLFISHNTHPYDCVQIHPEVGVVYNSHAMKDKLNYPNRSFVLHPVVDYRKWDQGGPAGDRITLINMNRNKGGLLFVNIARAMPDKKFLGVKGSYDPQMIQDIPSNLELIDNSPNMLPVYARTRILCCPSKYESWGMCASEAMANGIPVIYHPTFGLCENVGSAGIQVPDQNPDFGTPEEELKGGESDGLDPVANVEVWIKAIRKLDNNIVYTNYSRKSRKRAIELDPQNELQAFEDFIINFHNEA